MLLEKRVKNLRNQLKQNDLDAFLVSGQSNRYFLTGWPGDIESGFLLITKTKKFLITDSRYSEHAVATAFEIIESNLGVIPVLKQLTSKYNIKNIGYESSDLSVRFWHKLKYALKSTKLSAKHNTIEDIRKTKDSFEIEKISRACQITRSAFEYSKKIIKVGRSEKEAAYLLEKYMRENGADKLSWEPLIVAAGKNSSKPHYGAGNTKIKEGDMVQLDFGCVVDGYASDFSRVVFVGKQSEKQKQVYDLVVSAQKLGLSQVKAGVDASKIDQKVKQYMKENLPAWLDLRHIYQHALGHGVGIDVHELPFVSENRKSILEEGDVITIEPGIYIPGWGGVRIEDTVLVTKTGFKNLTSS